MKRVLTGIAVASLLFTCGVASADGLRAPYVAPPFSWTGFYVGGHVGGGWAQSFWTTSDHSAGNSEFVDQDLSGWVGGGQAGYRLQSGSWVFGIEATLAAANLRASDPACGVGTGPLPCTSPLVTVNSAFLESRETRIKSLSSVTGQLGYAWYRTLGYVKGGWAGGNLHLENSLTPDVCTPASNNPSCATTKRWANGWTVGTGIEYLVTQNVSIGVEYDYMHLTVSDETVRSVTGLTSTFGSTEEDIHQVVGRLNFRFGRDAPVALK